MDLYCFVLPQQLGILKHNPVSWDYKGGTSRKKHCRWTHTDSCIGSFEYGDFSNQAVSGEHRLANGISDSSAICQKITESVI